MINMKRITFLIFYLIFIFQISAQNLIKTTSANLNYRTNPKIDKNIICVIPKGTFLTIDYTNQTANSWIKLSYKGKKGFVYSKYLKDPVLKNNNKNIYQRINPVASIKHYTNSKGKKVQSPTYYKNQPHGATAKCRDGTYSFSRSRRGTCSHHGGVKKWLK